MFALARRHDLKIAGERSASFDLARGRLVVLQGAFALAYIILAARAADITLLQGALRAPDLADKPPAAAPPARIMRGDITDRNGVLLATTIKTPSLYVDPRLIYDHKQAAILLAKIFPDLSADDIYARLESGRRLRLRRDLTAAQKDAVLRIGEPGLSFEYEDRRVYPQENLTAHALGYVDIDNNGLAGAERGLDKILSSGQPARLTLDIRLQHILRREVADTIKSFSAIGGSGVILDARSGEILAGVSLPDFNPMKPALAKKSESFNRLTLGAYELGSVFKIFSTAAYIENFHPGPAASFDASKPLKIGSYEIHDYHAENRVLTIPEIFMHSSNIGAGLMGEALGGRRLKDFYKDLGLLNAPDFEIRETARPAAPADWNELATVTASFGHGLSVSPLQVASAAASIVNGGTLVRPHMTPRRANADIRVASDETARRMRELMRLVVTEGTGENADLAGYDIGGKTGTAEKPVNGRYDPDKLISSFLAAFPVEDPKYVIYVVIDEPHPNAQSHNYATAGWVAAPAVKKIVAAMAAVLGIPPEAPPALAEADSASPLRQYVSTGGRE